MLFISFVSAAEDVSVGRPPVVKRLWKHARCRPGKEGEGEREAADGERDEVNGNKFSVRRGRKRGEREEDQKYRQKSCSAARKLENAARADKPAIIN